MDIFKIQLDKAIKKGKIESFMLKKGKKDKEKIRKYSNYIIEQSYNYDWLSSYFLIYEGEELIDSIINNYDKIEKSTYNIHYIIKRICQFPEEKAIIYLDRIIPNLNLYYIYNVLDEIENKESITNYIINKHITDKNVGIIFAEALLRRNTYNDKVYENIDYIIKNNSSELFKLLKTKKLTDEVETKIKKSIAHSEEYLEKTIETILKDIYQTTYNKEKFKIGEDTIKIIIKEICKNENTDYGSIEYIGQGTFSYVIGIGNKVLKIGKTRNTKNFPNNPYIISPLMRETIDIDEDNKIFLEVTERADTNVQVNDEELYNLYKNLRQIGLVWTDMAKRNIGRLTKDNIIHWNTPINPTNESLELEEKRGDTILKKGQLVILDADHIYDEKSEEAQKKLSNSQYEKRYQEELTFIRDISAEKHYSLNELLDCRITGNTLHIHVVPKTVKADMETKGHRDYIKYADERLDNALTAIYEIITTKEQNIQNIFAVSPLLNHQLIKKMFEKQGFDTTGKPDKRFEEMFGTDKIGQATIKRDKFISLQEQKQEVKNKSKVRTLTLPNNNGFINSLLITSIIIIITILVAILIIK